MSGLFDKIGDAAGKAIKDMPGNFEKGLKGAQKATGAVADGVNSVVVKAKMQKGRIETRAKIEQKYRDVEVFNEDNRGNGTVKTLTENLVKDIETTKDKVLKLGPDDALDFINEVIEAYKKLDIPETNEGTPDEIEMINDKVSKIYRRANKLFDEVRDILEVQVKKESVEEND